MYPTSATYSQLVTDGETEQDLVIVFDNGTVLNSKYGDMVAGSASMTEYAFADTDVTYGECLSSEFSVEIPQSVMNANTVDGWARPFIAVNIGDKYTVIPSDGSATIGYGPTAWTVWGDGSFQAPADGESHMPVPWAASTVISLPGGGTATPSGWWNAFNATFVFITETQIIQYYKDYYGYPSQFVTTIENGTYDADGHFIPPASAVGNYTTTDYKNPSGHPYIYTRDGITTYYEMCPLGYFNFDSIEAVEGVTTSFVCPDALRSFDVDAADFISTVSDVATYPRAFGNYLKDICDYLSFNIDSTMRAWLNSVGSVVTRPVFSSDTTLRDIASWLAFTAGCNIRMTRDGEVGITRFMEPTRTFYTVSTTVPLSSTPVDVPATRVVAGSSQRKKYTSQPVSGLLVYDADGAATLYGTQDDAVFDLNYNPLMDGQNSTFYNSYLSDLAALPVYRPHTVSLTEADPSVTAGDMFFVEYESGSDLLFPLMSQTIRFEGRATAEYVTTASRDRAENRSAFSAGVELVNNYDLEKATTGKVPFNGEEDTDLDNASAAGFYDYLSSAANKPTTGGGALITIDGPSPYVMQYAMPRDSGGNSTAYVRQYTSSNVWGPWEKLLVASDLPTWTDVTATALSEADSSKATIGNLKLYACGNLRLLMGYITAVNLSTSQTTVANIASGHRPSDQVGVACAWDSARYVTWAIVGTGGALAVRSSSAYTSGNLRLNAIWLTA